ncbi:MAG TPA: hypothetical protein VJZ93_03735 [Candidatus Nanoarchaeia archaeon]|nr:hypothetical protein [Candidatus Nanoarchaeia archaeon]
MDSYDKTTRVVGILDQLDLYKLKRNTGKAIHDLEKCTEDIYQFLLTLRKKPQIYVIGGRDNAS